MENIQKLIAYIVEDLESVRADSEQCNAKDRLPLEIMALNAVVSACKYIEAGAT